MGVGDTGRGGIGMEKRGKGETGKSNCISECRLFEREAFLAVGEATSVAKLTIQNTIPKEAILHRNFISQNHVFRGFPFKICGFSAKMDESGDATFQSF